MEEGINNRMRAQTGFDGWQTPEDYRHIINQYEQRQKRMLASLNDLDAPPRLQRFKEEVIRAGQDQILYYEDYFRAKIKDSDIKAEELSNNDHLRSSDQKLHDADNYFKSLYPSMDKATNDAIERRVAWFDIV
jgi:hypothetical protein